MKSISASITFKNLTNRQDFTPQRFLFVVFLLWQIVSFLGILISKGELWTNIIWSGDSAALFPDFVETVFQSYGLKPYKTGAIYPPIVYVLFSLFTYLLPPSVFLNKKRKFQICELERQLLFTRGSRRFNLLFCCGIHFIVFHNKALHQRR